MSGRPNVPADIAKSADHKVFMTESEKAIAKLMPTIIGKSGSDFIREGYIQHLRDAIRDNPSLKSHIEERLQEEGLKLPFYLR